MLYVYYFLETDLHFLFHGKEKRMAAVEDIFYVTVDYDSGGNTYMSWWDGKSSACVHSEIIPPYINNVKTNIPTKVIRPGEERYV